MAIVTTQEELRGAIAAADPQIAVANDISLTMVNTVNYDLTITSETDAVTLSWGGAANGTMFSVTNGATLTVGNLQIDGLDKYMTAFNVQASTLVMNDGAVIRNLRTNSANSAIKLGILTDLSRGGALIMNGGLITGVKLDCAISCSGGSVTMNGTAAIANNQAYGIGVTRGTVTMTGSASIHGNVADRTGMGILASDSSVITMGLSEGDAPQIYNNESTNSYSGGIYLVDSVLNMNYGASIHDNTAVSLCGGVGMSGSELNMTGSARISGNTTQNGGGGGIFASKASRVTMTEHAAVSGNRVLAADGRGGGVYLQQDGTTLVMADSASVSGNSADLGAGIYVNAGTSLVMGEESADDPTLTGNTAAVSGGGLYINTGGTAELLAQAKISGNTAGTAGSGVYSLGTLRISQGAGIADGLYFNSAETAPTLANSLLEGAAIQLEPSDYVDPASIPVRLAQSSDEYPEIADQDKEFFILPGTFAQGTPVYLSAARDEVLAGINLMISGASFTITRIDPA